MKDGYRKHGQTITSTLLPVIHSTHNATCAFLHSSTQLNHTYYNPVLLPSLSLPLNSTPIEGLVLVPSSFQICWPTCVLRVQHEWSSVSQSLCTTPHDGLVSILTTAGSGQGSLPPPSTDYFAQPTGALRGPTTCILYYFFSL
jgi:hypothetical protein